MIIKNITLVCFCIAVAGVVAFWSLGGRTLGNHEAFVSVTAREMIANDEYIIPTFNHEYRLNKTPLPYWLVVAAARVTGEVDEFTARLPAAALSVLSVACILYFVTVLLDIRTAFLASMVWTCSLGFIRYSHCARPEMHLTFFMVICFLSFYAAIEEVNRRRQIVYSLIFWVSLGLSVLGKAPSSIIFMSFSAAIYLTMFKEWKSFKKIYPAWGFILFLLIVLPWPLAAARAMGWDLSLWQQESIGRFAGGNKKSSHALLYYFSTIFIFVIPWIVFMPVAVLSPFSKKWAGKRQFMGYLLVCLFTGIAFLSLCAGKRQHYILPLMPLAAILIGIVLEDMIFSRTAFGEKESVKLLRGHVFAFFLMGLLILALSFEPLYNYVYRLLTNKGVSLCAYSEVPIAFQIGTGLVLMLGAVLSFVFYSMKKRMLSCMVIFGSMAMVVVFCFSLALAFPDSSDKSEARFAVELKEMMPKDDDLFAYGGIDEMFIHYFGRPIKAVTDVTEFKDLYHDSAWLIVFGKPWGEIMPGSDFREVRSFKKVDGDEFEEITILHKGAESK